MTDEGLISPEDSSELRILSKIDHRTEDSWAFDDTFVAAFLKQVGNSRSFKYSSVINMYWRQKHSRREVATTLGMSLDGVKSLITTIRQLAEAFSKRPANSDCQAEPLEVPLAPSRCHTISKNDILDSIEGDEDKQAFIEEYGRLAVQNILSLFNSDISPRLIALQEQSNVPLSAREKAKLVKEADTLKSSVVRPDLAEGPIFSFASEMRTNYEPGVRGRPRKPKIVTVKRKRGRPRKIDFAEPPVENWSSVLPATADNYLVKNQLENIPIGQLCIPNEATLVQTSLN